MNTKSLLYSIVLIGGIAVTSFVLYPTGSPGGKTGSPGDGGANCTGCHSGSAQQKSNWITSNIPATGYIPGQTYTLTATGTHSGVSRFGFEITAENSSDVKTGNFVITNTTETKKVNNNKAVTHTLSGTSVSGDSKSWSFDWTGPASGTGTVKFYGAFNAANGDGGTTGDQIYLSTLTVNEATTGITENLAGKVDVKVYPNPFADRLEVALGKLEVPVVSLTINSQDGRTVFSRDLKNISQERVAIDASGFASGIYIVKVLFEDNSQASYKLIRN